MTFSEIKNKKLILYGTRRFCEAFELLFYELAVIRRVYEDETHNRGAVVSLLKDLLTESPHDSLTVICSFHPQPYAETLENLGLPLGVGYMSAEDFLWKSFTETPYYSHIYRMMAGKEIAVWGNEAEIADFLDKNPGIAVDFLINDEYDEEIKSFRGKPIVQLKNLEGRQGKVFVFAPVSAENDFLRITARLDSLGFKSLVDYCSDSLFEYANRTKLDVFKSVAEGAPVTDKYCKMASEALFVLQSGIAGCCISSINLGSPAQLSYTDAVNLFDLKIYNLSILNGTYIYCRGCGFLQTAEVCTVFSEPLTFEQAKQKMAAKPTELRLGYDPSCNLACKSCRTCRNMYHKMPIEHKQYIESFHNGVISHWIDHFDSVVLAITGDSFASNFYRDIAFNRYKGNRLTLQTNGLLVKSAVLEKLTELYKGRELRFAVSIDAAASGTYTALRGGNFDVLHENLTELGKARAENKISNLQINFIIQKQNFREMIDFVKLGQAINADRIYFQQLMNYCYSPEYFREINVYAPDHPDHAEFSEILKNPIFDAQSVLFEIPR